MPPLRYAARLLLLAAVFLAGCYTAVPEPTREAPAYARTTPHYRSFAHVDSLAAYLRPGSAAGPLLSAHRGGPLPGYPENALATLEQTLRHAPALLEVDLRLSRDSVLVLLHDETLDRTTTGAGPVDALPLEALRRLLLRDERGVVTPFRLPTLDETLAWAEGRAVLTLDVKREVPPALVVNAVRRMNAAARVVIIVYSLDDLLTYHHLAPELLLSASVSSVEDVDALVRSGVDLSRLVAFTGVGEVKPEVIERLHALDIRAIVGTFGALDDAARRAGPAVYEALFGRGVDIIATDLVPVAARAARHP